MLSCVFICKLDNIIDFYKFPNRGMMIITIC